MRGEVRGEMRSAADQATSQAARLDQLAMGDREWRTQQRDDERKAWGDRYPGATDWMRRDAAEARWRSREALSNWGEKLDGAVDRGVAGLGEAEISDEMLDDWRMGEFGQLLVKENNLRRTLYKWWLKVLAPRPRPRPRPRPWP